VVDLNDCYVKAAMLYGHMLQLFKSLYTATLLLLKGKGRIFCLALWQKLLVSSMKADRDNGNNMGCHPQLGNWFVEMGRTLLISAIQP